MSEVTYRGYPIRKITEGEYAGRYQWYHVYNRKEKAWDDEPCSLQECQRVIDWFLGNNPKGFA